MKPRISIILPTNRLREDILPKIRNIQKALETNDKDIFNKEFIPLISKRIEGINHYIELTLKSLEAQTFKDFELIISHKYPVDMLDVVKEYDLPIKLVAEKHSIWHDLGMKYPTLGNNINTSVIHSEGELLFRLDDLTLFNKNVLQEMSDMWGRGLLVTSRGYRLIDYVESLPEDEIKYEKVGARKLKIVQNRWRAQYKPLTRNPHEEIGKDMCWGFSSTLSRNDFLEVNGQNELFDGSISGTDMELGARIQSISPYNRISSYNLIYEVNDIPYKYMSRNDVVMRSFFKNIPIRANSWKPSKEERDRYKEWHISEYGDIDDNWDSFMNVPYLNMREECELRRLGEVVYEN